MWLTSPRVQRIIGGGLLERTAISLVAQLELLGLGGHKHSSIVSLIRRVRRERRWLVTANEAYLVYTLAKAQSKREGHMAETIHSLTSMHCVVGNSMRPSGLSSRNSSKAVRTPAKTE